MNIRVDENEAKARVEFESIKDLLARRFRAIQSGTEEERIKTAGELAQKVLSSWTEFRYEILLNAHSPALRITGELDADGNPLDAYLEWMDSDGKWRAWAYEQVYDLPESIHYDEGGDEETLIQFASLLEYDVR